MRTGRFAAFCLAAIATVGLAWLVAAQRGPIHFAAAGIEFDYPANWTAVEPGHPSHYESVLAYLGTGSAHQACGPDYIPGAGACTESYNLPAGTLILRLSIWDGPPDPPGQDRVTDILSSDLKASPTLIDGQPAVMQATREPSLGSVPAIVYTVQAPSSALISYRLEFLVNNPTPTSTQPTIDELLRTIRLAPLP